MKNHIIKVQQGFTLIELMVALVAGMFLLAGVSVAYSSISSSKTAEKEIENALDVIRFSSTLFSTSLKQTPNEPTIIGNTLSVRQEASAQACTGQVKTSDFTEIYSVQDEFLYCDCGEGPVKLLKGVQSISYSLNNNVVSVSLSIDNIASPLNGVVGIDIALTRIIMNEAFGS
ncbi:prepilin-type N-terminal cleavage/methylation domain-containing protein [Pseudoalteromonas sp. MMG010]|uniref:PilW family protein n=1 Tax=Pseudoalteromonas sp. MMG010 TaxID=2822685 RepID=UPI001B3A52EE|nr:prepilin-type N-terminal cleavage/methylation domain-containing protein [Pseudoalteromonas sp. MMG010]MBQ4833520.1 prepilin-type N-terminal cleavage/methylation domain-containing protein [Pseudoalteromonas sp. MMG010]